VTTSWIEIPPGLVVIDTLTVVPLCTGSGTLLTCTVTWLVWVGTGVAVGVALETVGVALEVTEVAEELTGVVPEGAAGVTEVMFV
jgi:hypothetical protein